MKHAAAAGAVKSAVNRFELLVQSVSEYAIYMLDPAGIVTTWNAGAQRFKGYKVDEIVGEHFSRFYSAEDRAVGLPARALDTAAREGRFEAEGWRIRKDGTRFWAHVVIDPLRSPSGDLIGFAKITRDLTERKAADEALRRSEERFRLLVQSVTDYAIYMLDPQGIIASWNPGAQRFKGYTEDEILGEHFSRFYTDEDRSRGLPATALATAAREGRFEAEGWRVRRDGTQFWASVVIDAVRDSAGTLIGFAKITRDLTERRQAQMALEQAREALFQSQKMEAVGKLTGGVAHDFNNLLAVVIGSLDLAKRRLAQGGDITRLLENAQIAAERGATLTQRMLAFARKQELKLEGVDATALIAGMADLLDRTIGAGILLETRFPSELAPVHADFGQLELTLLNLIVNARDAMPDGGRIVISGREELLESGNGPRLAPGSYVCLAVTDEGEGMDEETLVRATEPFFTTKGVGQGTGLGLSMVHGFAEQCGGKLVLKSRQGEGTTVELWLPVCDRVAPRDGVEETGSGEAVAPSAPLSVLAVDDDPLVLTSTAALLEEVGYQVTAANSPAAALAHLRAGRFDVLVTDYAMPQMTGVQLAAASQEVQPGLRVLMISGYADLPSGAAVSLPKLAKPFTAPQLADALAELTFSAAS